MKTKKVSAAIVTLGVLAAVIWAVVAFTNYFPPKPEDTALEFWICDDGALIDWGGHDEITGWMGAREFLGKDYQMEEDGGRPDVRVSYILTAWPDFADGGSYITTIEITDPAVSVYGLTVNSEPAEFEQVMTSMGYKVELEGGDLQKAVRDGFVFSLYHGDAPELSISAEVSNRDGIVY